MAQLHKTRNQYLLILFLVSLSTIGMGQNIVSYAYDYAGNRISRRVVNLLPPPTHAKKTVENPPAPVEEQLGERKIIVYPNPTKGALAVEITGGNDKDEIHIVLTSSQGIQLQTMKTGIGTTPVNLSSYPSGWYILRVKAGDKMTEFKIIKQ